MYTKTEAAYIILKESNKPLHLKEIIRIALEKNMIVIKGKTPVATLGADFINENKRRNNQGRDLRFVRVSEGIWGLVEWGLKPFERKPKGKKRL